jgi:hypothetical protein
MGVVSDQAPSPAIADKRVSDEAGPGVAFGRRPRPTLDLGECLRHPNARGPGAAADKRAVLVRLEADRGLAAQCANEIAA